MKEFYILRLIKANKIQTLTRKKISMTYIVVKKFRDGSEIRLDNQFTKKEAAETVANSLNEGEKSVPEQFRCEYVIEEVE